MLLLLCVKCSLAGCGSRRSRKPRRKGKDRKVKVWMRCLSITRWGRTGRRRQQPLFLPNALTSGLYRPGVIIPNLLRRGHRRLVKLRGRSGGDEEEGQLAGPSSQRPSPSPMCSQDLRSRNKMLEEAAYPGAEEGRSSPCPGPVPAPDYLPLTWGF